MSKKLKFLAMMLTCILLSINQLWGVDYNLVTNVSQLAAGDIVVISTSGGTTATTVENTNGKKDAYWYGYVASTGSVASGKLTALGTNTAEYTLSKSGDNWVLTCASGYVGSVSEKKLRYDTGTNTWTIAVNTTNYQATISSTTGNGSIQFNSDRFRTYTSSQTAVYLFKKESASTKTLVYNANGANGGSVPTDATAYNVGDKATVVGNTGSLTKVGFTWSCWNTAANGGGSDYAAGDKFTIGATGNTLYAKWTNTYAGEEFSLVENLSDLSNGSKIIILNAAKTYAISRTQADNNRTAVAYNASDNAGFALSNSDKTVTLASATTVQVITLRDLATPVANKYQFDVENGYLYAAGNGSGNNYLRTQTTNDANGHWLIGLSEGTFSVVAQGTNGNNTLKRNNSNAFFSCYSTGQENVLIYVKDEGTKYDITWANGGHGTAPTSPTSASKVTLPELSATGYTHTGWKADVAVTNTSTSSSISAGTLIANSTRVQLGAATTFTAQWTANSYDVTLKANTGSGDDQVVSATYDADMPTTLKVGGSAVTVHTKTGYTLLGYWDDASSGNKYYSYGGTPTPSLSSYRTWNKTAATNLYAHWQANTYTISFDQNGGTGGQTSDMTATYDAAMPTPVTLPTYTGHDFQGYYDASSGGTQYYTNAGASARNWDQATDKTLYAQWTNSVYSITYKDQGDVAYTGSNSGSLPATHTYNSATELVDGVKAGYQFDGWFTASGCTGNAITSLGATSYTANITLYAKWTILHDKYFDRMHANGASTEAGTGYKYDDKSGAGYTIPKPSDEDGETGNIQCEKDHYKFVGWVAASDMNDDGTLKAGYTIIAGGGKKDATGTTYYAIWAEEE